MVGEKEVGAQQAPDMRRQRDGVRTYGTRAPREVQDAVRSCVDDLGVPETAHVLGVSVGAVLRTIAGARQVPGTIDRITARLAKLAGQPAA